MAVNGRHEDESEKEVSGSIQCVLDLDFILAFVGRSPYHTLSEVVTKIHGYFSKLNDSQCFVIEVCCPQRSKVAAADVNL